MGQLTVSDVKYWLSEADSCVKRQEYELNRKNHYPFLINYYEGIQQVNATSPFLSTAEVYLIISEYFPNTNSLISEIMYQNPDISAEATKPDAQGNEFLMASALRYGFNKVKALNQNRVALFDMLYAGYSCVEVDHLKEDEGVIILPDEKRQGFVERSIGKVKEAFTQKESEEKATEEEAGEDEKFATPEKTLVRRWNPLNVPLDWKAETIEERRYNLKKVWLSKAEFDKKYPQLKNEVFPTEDKDSKITYAKFSSNLYNKKVLLYEFQIRKKGNEYWNLIVSPQYTRGEIDYYKRDYVTNGFNMKIGMLHRYGKLYPVSFAQVNKKLHDEMNEYVRFMMKVAERNIPKFIADKNKVKVDAEGALRSTQVNDIAFVDGNPQGAVVPLQPTNISVENKELIQIFQQQKEKLWSISESRLSGKSGAEFMGELEIQEAGFQASKGDIQEGLKDLLIEEIETLKDIIVVFWDGEYFFKVTGGPKPEWYIPQKAMNPMTGEPMVLNSLTDILTNDYEIKIDITSSLRPNKERKKKELVEFLSWLTSPNVAMYLQSQGKTINIEEFKKVGQQYGFNAETLLIDMQPMAQPGMEGINAPNSLPVQ